MRPVPVEGLRTLALTLLVAGPYSLDGVPTPLIAAAWPRDDHARRAHEVGRRVVEAVRAGQVSPLDVRYASEQATAASTRPFPAEEVDRDPASLFPLDLAARATATGWVPHLFAEEPLDVLVWPDGSTPAPDVAGRRDLAEGLGRLHAVCLAASALGGAATDLDDRLPALVDLLARVRCTGAEGPTPAVSSVMLLLSAVVGAEDADVVREVAGLLASLRDAAGWVPSEEPWGTPSQLFGSDTWLVVGTG